MYDRILVLVAALGIIGAPLVAFGGSPAARVGDRTTHVAQNNGPGVGSVVNGSPDVLIDGRPAARATDRTVCDGSDRFPCGLGQWCYVPHVSGSIVVGSSTVLINGLPAARLGGDVVVEPTAVFRFVSITEGSSTVFIGP